MTELLTLPPDSKRIRARETLPVTTGEGDLRRMERGVARVELPPFVGVYNGLKGLLKLLFVEILVRFSTSSSSLFSNNFLA